MTPTKESLDRATEWVWSNHRDLIHETWMVNSLALLLDRVRLEGKIELCDTMERNKWMTLRRFAPEQLKSVAQWAIELRQQLAALNQRAGEKEG